MGAWGPGHFDNDTACDWAYDLEDASDLSYIKDSIQEVFSEDYLDSDIACEALAAIEVLARLRGHFGKQNAYTETIDKWVIKNKFSVSKELITLSNNAINRILDDKSELAELWEHSPEWIAEVNDLKDRINK